MIRLQIAISNLQPTSPIDVDIPEISFKFASITTTLPVYNGQAGKTLYLEISPEQMQEIYHLYACGLYLENSHGRYFCLLDLQRVKVSEKVICQEINFFNDLRQTKFKGEFSIAATTYKNPRTVQNNKYEQRDNALNLMKKPPVPKANQTAYNNFVAEKPASYSFLKGNRASKEKKEAYLPDHLKTMKNGVLPSKKSSKPVKGSSMGKAKTQQIPKQFMARDAEVWSDDGTIFENSPPPMEFTNEEQHQTYQVPQVPRIQHLQYGQSIEQNTQARFDSSQRQRKTEPKFATFNKNTQERKNSPQTPSQFQLYKKDSKQLPPKNKAFLSREDIKMLAKEEAQAKEAKQNVMIPIAKGGKFELVPLSSLKPEEIIDYVHRQRKIQEEAEANQQIRRRLQAEEREVQEKNKRLQLAMEKRQKEKSAFDHRPSTFSGQRNSKDSLRNSVNVLIHEEPQSEPAPEEDYMSDFQSISLTGSAIRSRISSKGGLSKKPPKEEESIMDEDYSQDFDSYSQSMLSRTNPNKNKGAGSISDYSDSYRSISQSYRK